MVWNTGKLKRNTSTASTPVGSIALSDVSKQILASNALRISAEITNDAVVPMYLALGATAVVNKGIRLNANGGEYKIDLNNLFTGAINAVSSSDIQEVICVVEKVG